MIGVSLSILNFVLFSVCTHNVIETCLELGAECFTVIVLMMHCLKVSVLNEHTVFHMHSMCYVQVQKNKLLELLFFIFISPCARTLRPKDDYPDYPAA